LRNRRNRQRELALQKPRLSCASPHNFIRTLIKAELPDQPSRLMTPAREQEGSILDADRGQSSAPFDTDRCASDVLLHIIAAWVAIERGKRLGFG
jgi:hypothetical protein